MRKLDKDDKALLKAIVDGRWFKILEELVEDFRITHLTQFESVNLWDPEVLQKLNGSQNYLKGAKSLMSTIKSQTNQIWKKDKEDYR